MIDHELKPLLEALLAKLDGMEARLKAVEAVAHKQVVMIPAPWPQPSYLPGQLGAPPDLNMRAIC